MQRRRIKQPEALQQRLLREAQRLRDEARLLPPGLAREVALRKARQRETAAHLTDWLRSPGLVLVSALVLLLLGGGIWANLSKSSLAEIRGLWVTQAMRGMVY